MPRMFDDFTGRVFGFLTVIEQAPADEYFNTRWRCRCTCGEERIIRASQLREGKFFTCGAELCRFWSKVDKTDGCWNWMGALKETGYGAFRLKGAKATVPSHRYAWEQTRGPIPKDKWLLHTCDNPRCVNPDHLYLGTHQDNVDDMIERGRHGGWKHRRLTTEEKNAMKADYKRGGSSHPDLAKKYGTSLKTVGRTLRGESKRRKRS